MATATTIKLSTADTGVFSTGVRADSAEVASQVLQEDLQKHHIYFNVDRFHNHIVHHVLSLYALGASPEAIRTAYERGSSYQRPVFPVDEGVVNTIIEKHQFQDYLGKEEHYPNFLVFFQREIDDQGVEAVVNEHLFAGDDHAEDMLVRLFAGFLHPLIHLGFGIEFNQPAIVAEALAQTATHDRWIGDYLLPAEKSSAGVGSRGTKTLVQLFDELRQDSTIAQSVHWSDGNKIRDGVMKRAPREMINYASQYTVSADQLEEKLAEMINAVVYYTTTAQHPPKEIKFDFFLMHCVTSSIFYSAFFSRPWINLRTKIRLLEWKGRMDLAMYVSRGVPKLLLEEVTNYPVTRGWNEIFHSSVVHPQDDGHVVKMVRAVANGERVCKPFEGQGKEKGFVIHGDMWLKIGNMIIDSVSGPGRLWVRSTGFEEAWAEFQDRPHLIKWDACGELHGVIVDEGHDCRIAHLSSRDRRHATSLFTCRLQRRLETSKPADICHSSQLFTATMGDSSGDDRSNEQKTGANSPSARPETPPRSWLDKENPFIAFRRYADEQISSMLQSVMGLPSIVAPPFPDRWLGFADERNHYRQRNADDSERDGRSTDSNGNNTAYDQWLSGRRWSDLDDFDRWRFYTRRPFGFFGFDSFFDDHFPFGFGPFHSFHPFFSDSFFSGEGTHSWPIPYLLFSPYSPLHLERSRERDRHRGVFSSLFSSLKSSAETDRPEPRWRDAFEDLVRIENGQPMLDRSPDHDSRKETGNEWLQGLIQRGSLGSGWKLIGGADDSSFSSIVLERSARRDNDKSLTSESSASSTGERKHAESEKAEPATELDLYDRFLQDIFDTHEREYFRAFSDSPLMRLLYDERKRHLEEWEERRRQWEKHFRESESSWPRNSENDVPDTKQHSGDVKDSEPSIISTLTTRERRTLPDGSVQTKIVKTKRFSDGREESDESVEVVNPPAKQTQRVSDSNNASDGNQDKSNGGWFWRG